MSSFAMNLLKAAALWVVLMIGRVLFGWDFATHDEGPLDAGQALFVVNGIEAVVLALLAACMRPRGWRLGLTLAAVLFGVETFLNEIEAVVFKVDSLSWPLVYGVATGGLLHAVLAGAAAAVLWRGPGEAPLELRGLVWKTPLIAVLWIVCYFIAGIEIALRFAAVRNFYGQHVGHIDGVYVLEVQFCRGLVWCGIVWLLARSLSRPAWRAALLTGLALTSFMAPLLLYPNPVMHWPQRVAHLLEIGVGNTVFGVVAALILLAGAREAAPASASDASAPQLAGA